MAVGVGGGGGLARLEGLDAALVRRSAPALVYRRGQRYFRAGFVVKCEESADAVTGLVVGTQPAPYRTSVTVRGRRLEAQCTCKFQGPVCKHAVALALAALAARADCGRAAASVVGGVAAGPRGGAGARAGGSATASRGSATASRGGASPSRGGASPSRGGAALERPPAWEEALSQALAGSGRQGPQVGETHLVCRLQPAGDGLLLALSVARYGQRGLGVERPVPWRWRDDPAQAPVPYGHLFRLLDRYDTVLLGIGSRCRVSAELVDACLELLGTFPFVFVEPGGEPFRLAEPLVGRLALVEVGAEAQAEAGAGRGAEAGAWTVAGAGAAGAVGGEVAADGRRSGAGQPAEDEGGYRLEPSFTGLGGAPWEPPPGTRFLCARRLWLFYGGTFRPVHCEGHPQLLALAATREIVVPKGDLGRFIRGYLPALRTRASLDLPPSLARRVVEGVRPRPVLILKEEGETLLVQLRFAYGDGAPQVTAGQEEPELVEVLSAGEVGWALRDREAERAACAELEALGLRSGPDGIVRLEGEEALDFLAERLPSLGKWWEVYGQEDLRRLRVARARPRCRATLTSGIDWFDLDLSLEWEGGAIGLEQLLPYLQAGRRWVPLADGSHLRLPDAWRERYGQVLRELDRPRLDGGRLRVRRWDLAVAAEWLEAAEKRRADAGWRPLASLLDGFRGIEEQPLPASLRAELRSYQRRGYDWLCFLRDHGFHGVLADDMGLGKTVQTLALLLSEKESGCAAAPSLLVVPTSLVFNWLAEARRFAPSLSVLPLVGSGRHRHLRELARHDVVLTTYALLRRDGERLAQEEFHYLILDEAHQIKNPASQTARVAKVLRARHRLALTGTPLENNLMELWSLFDFLMPGFLGSQESFARRYAQPAQADGEVLVRLRRRVRPFLLRRTREEVLRELPPRTETILSCELTGAQRRLYQEMLGACRERVLTAVAERGIDRSRVTILDALLKLRQICCDPRLLRLPGSRVRSSAKLDLFREVVGDIVGGGHRVLVFSQFATMLGLLREELRRMGIPCEYLDGRTRDREARVRRFQEGAAPVFLISLKAGGLGLNLTNASYVIHYDPWWNPAAEEQAAGRAHRLGQTQPVTVYKLVARGTVEEKILELQRRKRALVRDVLGGDGLLGARLTREDLEALFSLA